MDTGIEKQYFAIRDIPCRLLQFIRVVSELEGITPSEKIIDILQDFVDGETERLQSKLSSFKRPNSRAKPKS